MSNAPQELPAVAQDVDGRVAARERTPWVGDPVAALFELAELKAGGFITDEEYGRQRAKVIEGD